MTKKDQPVGGNVYRITGGRDVPSVLRGDTWEASIVIRLMCETCGKTYEDGSPNSSSKYCSLRCIPGKDGGV